MFALADPLKHLVSDVLQLPIEAFYSEEGKACKPFRSDKTLRDALVEISAAIKVFKPTVWLSKAIERCSKYPITIITDVRTLAEEEYLREHSQLTLIKVLRKESPYSPETYLTPMELEVSLLTPDIVVPNDGSLLDLEQLALVVSETCLEEYFNDRR